MAPAGSVMVSMGRSPRNPPAVGDAEGRADGADLHLAMAAWVSFTQVPVSEPALTFVRCYLGSAGLVACRRYDGILIGWSLGGPALLGASSSGTG